MAGQALGVVPPAQAFGADAARVKGVPGVTAATTPKIIGAWGPFAKRAADAAVPGTGIGGLDVRRGVWPMLHH